MRAIGVLGLLWLAIGAVSARPPAALASEFSPLIWGIPTAIDDEPPFADGPGVYGMSCPSAQLCVAALGNGDVFSSTNPTGGTGAWKVASADRGNTLEAVSCPSEGLCVASDNAGDVLVSSEPAGSEDTWTAIQVDPGLPIVGISCPSTSLCVAVDGAGNILSSTDPAGGASAWHTVKVETEVGLSGISCASEHLCVAVDQDGDVLSAIEPTGGPESWSIAQVNNGHDLRAIACPSESLCVAAGPGGNVITATNPAGGAGAWTSTQPVGERPLDGVSCSSPTLCVIVDAQGDAITSTDPTGGASAWSAVQVEADALSQVSCAPESICIAGATQDAAVVTSINPGTGAWSITHLDVGYNNLHGISCASEVLCIAIGSPGNVLASTEPRSTPAIWAESHVDEHELNALSCPTANLCVAVDEDGGIVTATNPAGASSAWRRAEVDGAIPLTGISCPTASLCVAIDREGDVVTSTDPTGGAEAWTVTAVNTDSKLKGVSCPIENRCVLTNGEGDIITSSDPTAGAQAWSSTYVHAGSSISCPSVTLCVTVGSAGTTMIAWGSPAGGSWHESQIEDVNALDEVSCASEHLCVATSYGNGTNHSGEAVVSSNPTGGVGAWILESPYNFNTLQASAFARPSGIGPLLSVDLTGVSCVASMCALVNHEELTMVGAQESTPQNTTKPMLSGVPAIAETLSCSTGSWSGRPVPTLSYQWLRDGVPIANTTAGSYVVQADDAESEISCEVTATNNAGSKSASSGALQIPVAQIPGPPSGEGPSGSSAPVSPQGGSSSPTTGGLALPHEVASNLFKLVGIAHNSREQLKLTLMLPGPGELEVVVKSNLSHKRQIAIGRLYHTATKAGRVTLTIKPSGKARRLLHIQGTLRVIATIIYTPNGGKSRSIIRTATLVSRGKS